MDEQNINPMDTNAADNTGNPFGTIGTQDPYSMSGSGDPYGMNGTQNPYGAGETQNPYGTNGASNPYGANGTQNPYGADGTQNPYGTNGAQNPYGASGVQNPYGANAAQNPYGAGGMQNPYGTNGAYGSGSVTPPKPPKKKMSKKAKILIFGGIGLAAVAVAAVLLCIYVFFPAKKTVKSALDNMLGSEGITSGSLLFKELGMDTLASDFSKSGGELKADLKVGDGNGRKLNVTADVAMDKASKQLAGELILSSDKEELADGSVFIDENQTYVTVEDLLKGYFAIDNKNVMSGLKNSWILSNVSNDRVKSILNMIPDFDIDIFNNSSLISMEKITSDDNKLWKDSRVSKEGSETLYAGEISVSAKKYSITIPKETLQEFVEKAVDSAMNSLGNVDLGSVVGGSGISASNISQYVTQAKALIKSMFSNDLVIYVYIKDDKVISIKANYNINLMTYNIGADVDFTSIAADGQSITNLSASLDVVGQKIEAKASAVTKEAGDDLKTDINISVSARGKDLFSGSYDQVYSKSAQTISGSGSINVNGSEGGSISVTGKVTELNKGKKITVHFDDISMTAGSKTLLTVEGDVTVSTMEGVTLKQRDTGKPVANLFTGSAEDAKQVLDEESEGYKKFSERVKKFFRGEEIEIEDN